MNKKRFVTLFFLFVILFPAFSKEVKWTAALELNQGNLDKFFKKHQVKGKLCIQIWEKTNLGAAKVVISDKITLNFVSGGLIHFDKNEQLQINGFLHSEKEQIFDVKAIGVNDIPEISFQKTKDFYPEWWGYFPEKKGTWAYYNILREMMLDLRASGGGHVHFSAGNYYIRDLIVDSDNITISGEGVSKTVLKYDNAFDTTSTRQGTIVSIRGPITEVKTMGNDPWTTNKQIENIVFRDLSIEYDYPSKFDKLMNGISILNAKNVLIENVDIDLNGGHKAYFIGAMNSEEKTENITIRSCSAKNCLIGVFITYGYPVGKLVRVNKKLGGIVIEKCTLRTKRSDPFVKELGYSCGIYIFGFEKTTPESCILGMITLRNNQILESDFGIRTGINDHVDNQNNYELLIEGNTLLDFKICGIYGSFKQAIIRNNTFNSSVLENIGAFYENAAIHIRKAPSPAVVGTISLVIEGNTFVNLSASGTPVKNCILLIPANEAQITIDSNVFVYENKIVPQTDVVCYVNEQEFANKSGTLNYGQNKFPQREKEEHVKIKGGAASPFKLVNKGTNSFVKD